MRSWDDILHDPRIDDSGDYDYLAEELPADEAYWIKGDSCRCETCGRESRLSYRRTHSFYCYDGWDTMDYTECWKSVLSDKWHAIRRRLRTLLRERRKRHAN